jgi:hypothetical protein
VSNLYDALKKAPILGQLLNFAELRPRLAAWIVLSLGIVILLLIEARDVGLLIGQWAALIVASVLVAGLCIWIVSWEDRDEETPAVSAATPASPAPTAIATTDETNATPVS